MLRTAGIGRTKDTNVRALRRLATAPAPALLREWRGELLALALLGGGLVGMLTGAY